MYAAFVGLKKTFDAVPRKVVWWSLRKFCEDEWVIYLVKAMYSNAQSSVQANGSSSQLFKKNGWCTLGICIEFLVVHVVMEAISREFRVSYP